MATKFKPITQNSDVATTKALLHEAIPLTGTIVSGTYVNKAGVESNIKNYSHGMFQSVYDYAYLSSSANHIFDLTVGYSSNSALSGASNTQNSKKINIYNQMAQVLVGHDKTGSILDFDRAGDDSDAGTKMRECFFLNYSRLLTKDEIKKESFTFNLLNGTSSADRKGGQEVTTISDYGASTTYKTNSPAGEYGLLFTGSVNVNSVGNPSVGHVYYQSGIVVLTASLVTGTFGGPASGIDKTSVNTVLTASNISHSCDAIRNVWQDCSFNNTTELNSTVYFCRANFNEFNYSSNPTYLSSSQIRVKKKRTDQPLTYITTVGLYSSDNQLMAVAKLSEPLKKTPSNEFTLRVRLDY
tara:strand:- start:1377 stop:2441 length:1065 start_codon:yes stop_codon:yes gene_type:complete